MTIATTVIESPLAVETAAGARAAAVDGACSAVVAVAVAEAQVEALWLDMRETARRRAVAYAEEARLFETLPWWAKEGPSFLRADGTFVMNTDGRPDWIVGWPAINDPHIFKSATEVELLFPDDVVNIRPSPRGLAERWRRSPAARLPVGHPDRRQARARHRGEVRALVARIRHQRQLKAAAGIDAIGAQCEALNERVWELEDAVEAIAATTPNAMAAAASLLIALKYDAGTHNGPISEMPDGLHNLAHVLSFLRPSLFGILAADVAELLDNPERSVQEHPLWKL